MENIDKKKKVTELGLLDLGLRDNGYRQNFPEREYEIWFCSWEPERVSCSIDIVFTGLEIDHSVMINTNGLPPKDMMRRLNLKVYGDIDKLEPDVLFREFYLKSEGFLYFASSNEEMRLADLPEIQSLDEVRARAMVLAAEDEARIAKYNLFYGI